MTFSGHKNLCRNKHVVSVGQVSYVGKLMGASRKSVLALKREPQEASLPVCGCCPTWETRPGVTTVTSNHTEGGTGIQKMKEMRESRKN